MMWCFLCILEKLTFLCVGFYLQTKGLVWFVIKTSFNHSTSLFAALINIFTILLVKLTGSSISNPSINNA